MIAGAGPSGSRLAELLAIQGVNVILVDRLKSAEENCFSSAVVPINSIDDNLIPSTSVSSYWKSWQIFDPKGKSHQWNSDSNLGAVLDFAKLRKQLWRKAKAVGVEFLCGWTVRGVSSSRYFVDVELQGPNCELTKRRVLYVIDATGHNRLLIGPKQISFTSGRDILLEGSGVEWILQGNSHTSNKWNDRITFFLGSSWIKHGYGWIFPMSQDRLKVGFCSLPPSSHKNSWKMSNGIALKNLLKKFDLNALPVLDRHGGIIRSTLKRQEAHISGRIIGVGDTVSTANLLGGEGIRHALLSAEVLAPLLLAKLRISASSKVLSASSSKELINYQKQLNERLGWRWSVSNRLGKKTWWGLTGEFADQRLIKLIDALTLKASAEEISALLFDYRFERYGLKLLPYLFGWR